MRIQLWSYNYDPEPTGIGPLSTVWAKTMRARGHDVQVVAAHPHYPAPNWGTRLRPYRERRDGVPVLRLPLWIGRASGAQRVRQEASYMLAQTAALPLLPRPDVVVAVSPSFPALATPMVNKTLRRVPWVLWLQDILPDGAASTGLLEPGPLLDAARRFEIAAYRSADHLVVISESFEENLRAKGVEPSRLTRIYNTATRPVASRPPADRLSRPVVLNMGNIGFSQGLAPLVAAFERSSEMAERDVEFVMAGDGVAAAEVRSEIRSDRVRITGVLDPEPLDAELQRATVGLVSQRYAGAEFNVPSKLMNFMACGIAVVASVRADSEVARLIHASAGGWWIDSADPDAFPRAVAEILRDPDEIERRGAAARDFAAEWFTPEGSAERFERVLEGVAAGRR